MRMLRSTERLCFLTQSQDFPRFTTRDTKVRSVWGDSLVGKGTCHQSWQLEFESQSLQSGRRELTSVSCPLTTTCVPQYQHEHTERDRDREHELTVKFQNMQENKPP